MDPTSCNSHGQLTFVVRLDSDTFVWLDIDAPGALKLKVIFNLQHFVAWLLWNEYTYLARNIQPFVLAAVQVYNPWHTIFTKISPEFTDFVLSTKCQYYKNTDSANTSRNFFAATSDLRPWYKVPVICREFCQSHSRSLHSQEFCVVSATVRCQRPILRYR